MTTATTTISPLQTATTHGRSSNNVAARYLVYPTLLLANALWLGLALSGGMNPALATMVGLQVTLAALFLLEWRMPFDPSWHPSKREVLRDLFYYGMNGGLDATTKMGVGLLAAAGVPWANALPLPVAILAAILTAELSGYWLHRFGHAGWLWKVHGVHHTPDKVNTWNNNTIHFLNSIYGGLGKALPLTLLGFDPVVIVVAIYFSTLQSFAVHANVDVELGRLGRYIMGPAHHRLHHSTDISEAGNFATGIALWDRLFGTFVYGDGRTPPEVGVAQPETFPSPMAVLRNQLHPFVGQARSTTALAAAPLIAAFALVAGPAHASAPRADASDSPRAKRGNVVLLLTGLESRDGNVLCALFAAGRWLDTPVKGVIGQYTRKGAVCRFDDVPFGRYGIAVHHDEDGDGQMDTFLGIPSEPYGFSRDALGTLGPPSFCDASFLHRRSTTLQRATVD